MSYELDWQGTARKKDVNDGVLSGLLTAVNLVQSSAKLLCTVDTGNLRSSISKDVDSDTLKAYVSTNVYYGLYVEFGLKSNPNYPVQPFMRPALYDNQSRIKSIMVKAVSSKL